MSDIEQRKPTTPTGKHLAWTFPTRVADVCDIEDEAREQVPDVDTLVRALENLRLRHGYRFYWLPPTSDVTLEPVDTDTLAVDIGIVLKEARRGCPCRVDAELNDGGVCPSCGHRDHGRSGCKAAKEAEE